MPSATTAQLHIEELLFFVTHPVLFVTPDNWSYSARAQLTEKGDDVAQTYMDKMQKPSGKSARKLASDWPQMLLRRKLAARAPGRKARHAYHEAVRKDRRLARRKIFFPENLYSRAPPEQEAAEIQEMEKQCGKAADEAINDDGLPSPADSVAAQVSWTERSFPAPVEPPAAQTGNGPSTCSRQQKTLRARPLSCPM